MLEAELLLPQPASKKVINDRKIINDILWGKCSMKSFPDFSGFIFVILSVFYIFPLFYTIFSARKVEKCIHLK
nr:MAG TPA: hypothetical protein [Caudoviricetes sp.]